jgi:ligand-binding sensor domain-containing protein/signal transduction histidine kinase
MIQQRIKAHIRSVVLSLKSMTKTFGELAWLFEAWQAKSAVYRRFSKTFFLCRLLLFVVVFYGIIFPTSAAPADYLIRTWQMENGLPQNKVTAIVQTQDGYLWLGTYNGLARFDGVHFAVFDDNTSSQLLSSRITSLCEAPDGVLWIGDESGHVTQYKNGQFLAAAFHPQWKGGKIYEIATDQSGDVWLMNEWGELARARDGLVLLPPSGPVAKVVSMVRSPDGTIWIDREGVISGLNHARLTPLQIDGYIQGICASRDGGLWVAYGSQVRKWKNGKWVTDPQPAPWGGNIITKFKELESGALAAGTPDNGLFIISSGQQTLHFNRTNHFPSDWILSLWEDREGNLWNGTGAGLVMMRANNIQTFFPPDQWQGRAVLSVCPGTKNALWIGTEGAGLYRLQNGAWTKFVSEQGIRNPYIWSLAEDSAGRLHAGTWGGGLFIQQHGGFIIAPGMTNLTPPMPSLLSETNSLWIGTTEGLLHYQDGKAAWINRDGARFGDVRAMVRDKQGALWIGTAGNGLFWMNSQTVHQFRATNGLSSDFIECLHMDEDGTMWIGTFGGGLNRFRDGHFSVVNSREGLPNNIIGDIETDTHGYFWMSSYGGILRVSRVELNQCADHRTSRINCLVYGIDDGLPTLECSEGLQPAGCRTGDGRLWFPTAKGLVSIDPANVTTNSLPPPVVIEAMLVDDHPFNPPFRVPPGHHRFDFQYAGLSFVAPEKMQFKCRLSGLDKDWVNLKTKRLASYDYIPPGDYSFQVTACNNDGVWNQTAASMTFSVLPFFWQTIWFRSAMVAALIVFSGGLVWFDTRRRMRQRLEKLERERAVERERARIAQDIHDDLGASLTRITMLSQSARGETQLPEPITINLERIYVTAREVTRAMDEIVWAVNPRHDWLDSLANYLSRFAYEYLNAMEIRCRLEVPLELPSLPVTAEVRHNLFLAFKEALHNIVKHATANEARVELKLEAATLMLIVADNGRGFDVTSLPKIRAKEDRIANGNGLANMNRRLAEIHGMCDVLSEPGRGTTVKFTVRLCP